MPAVLPERLAWIVSDLLVLPASVPDNRPRLSQPTLSLAVQANEVLPLLVSVMVALVRVVPKSTWAGDTVSCEGGKGTVTDTGTTSETPELTNVTFVVYVPGARLLRAAVSETLPVPHRDSDPDLVPIDSQPALSVAVQLIVLGLEFVRVSDELVLVEPKLTLAGEISRAPCVTPPSSAIESTSTGDEVLQAAAIAAQSTALAA